MAGDDVVLNYVANDAGMIAFQRKLRNELDREREKRAELQKTMKDQATTARTIAREQATSSRKRAQDEERVAKVARKAIESLKTPYQQYEGQLHELQEALNANKLSTDQFRGAKMKLLKQMREEKRAQDGTNDELREAAAVIGKTRTATERYETSIARLNKLRAKGRIDAKTHKQAIDLERKALADATPKAESFGSEMLKVAGGVGLANLAMEAGRKAVELLRQEYDRLIERQQKSLGATTTLAAAQNTAVNNLGNDARLNPQRLFKRLRNASQRMGIDEAELTTAAGAALSARGDNTADAAVDSVIAAAGLARFDEGTRTTLAGSALDLSKNNNRGLEGSLGFMLKIGQLSRVQDPGKLGRNAPPAVSGAQAFGASEEVGGAMFSAISQGAVDFEGALSKTGTIQLAKQLSEFAPGAGVGGGIRALQTLPGAREEFFAPKTAGGFGASFDAATLGTIKQLLTAGSPVARQYNAALTDLQGTDGQTVYDERVGQINSLPSVQTAMLNQSLGNAANQLALADQGGARSAAIREGLAGLRSQLGQGGVNSKLTALLEDAEAGGVLDSDGLRTGLVTLRDDLRGSAVGGGKRAARNAVRSVPGMGASGALADGAALLGLTSELAPVDPAVASAQADVMDSLIALLDQQMEIQKMQLQEMKQMNAAQQNAGNQAAVMGRQRNRGEAGP